MTNSLGRVAGVITLVTAGLGACSDNQVAGECWDELARLGTPTITDGRHGIMEVGAPSLDDVLAWSKISGGLGLPDRFGDRPGRGNEGMTLYRIGKELLARRGTDESAVAAVTHLGHRLRTEGRALLEVLIGFELAELVRVHRNGARPTRDEQRLAPTEAEIRHALAADALFVTSNMREEGMERGFEGVDGYFADMVFASFTPRGDYLARVDEVVRRAQRQPISSLAIAPQLPRMLRDVFIKLDSYRAWTGTAAVESALPATERACRVSHTRT